VSLVVHYTASALRNLAKLAEDVAPLLYEKNEAGAWNVAAGGVENGKQLKREHLLWYDGFATERANSHLYMLREKLLKAPGGGSKGNKSQVQDCTKEVYDFCRQASGVHKVSFLTKLGLNKLAGVSMYGGASSSSSSSSASAAAGAATPGAGQVDAEPTAEQVAKQLEKQTRDHAIANATITGSSGAAASSSFSKPLQPAQPTKKPIIQDDLLMDILKAESRRESGAENSTGNGGAEQLPKPSTARDAAIRMFGASSSTAAKKKNEKPPNSGGAAKVKKANGKTKASAAGSVKSSATLLGGISALGGFASLLEPNKRVNSQNKPSGLQLGGKVASTNTTSTAASSATAGKEGKTKTRDAMPATEADQAGDRAAVAPSSKTRCESLAAAGASVVRKNSKEDFKRQLPKEVLRADSHIADKMASFMRLEEDDRREAARSRKPSQEDSPVPPAGGDGEGTSCNKYKRKSHDGAGGRERDEEQTGRMRDETENCSDSRPPPSKKKRTLKAQNSVANTEILPDNTQRLGGTSGMKSAHKEGALGAASSGSAPATLAAAANTTSDASSSAPSAVPPVFRSATGAGCSSSCSGGASTSSSSNLARGAQSANVDVAASGAAAPSGDPGAPAAGSMKTRANSDEVVLIDDDTSDDDVFSANFAFGAAARRRCTTATVTANSTSSASCSAGSKADIMKQAQPQSSSKDSDPAPGSLFSSFLNDRGGNREVKKEKLKKKAAANNPPKRSPGQLQAAARVQEKSPTPARQPQGKKAGEDFFAKFAHSTAKKPQLSKES